MRKRVAVMDLGTNTFHLLIVEGLANDLKELRHDHVAVKLGEGGINKGLIQPAAFERGLNTMKSFQQYIEYYGVKEVKAIATSAMRSAANGKDFMDQVKAETGIQIETINGDSEASYIFYGVKASDILGDATSLILDIGGGSIEFIIANHTKIFWKQSFEIGAARLMDKFHQIDPIPVDCIKELHQYIDTILLDFYAAAQRFKIENLIGSSGAFETFAEIAERTKGNDFDLKKLKSYQFDSEDLISLTDSLIRSSHEQRLNNPCIIPVRIDMIVVASIVTRYLMQKLNINKICMSAYSLKEGVLAEMLG
ncbi:exopolyphosphatase [Mucilaginibacter jinjuensis]|uniref:Exopolyphosphatase n=1 Tax=Mucilaginibacter jinjuensis TaxID=1176721 RepID=A0ABY7T2X6_9SPHI|nr:exopolyphosphatase [Mucilaginibacter jinjuensis]WCT10757.1 exopolyphosphatase [Mucilaginibacter jinjuensis]